MTKTTQELTFQQQLAKKRKEIKEYQGVLERYLNSPSRTNRWYNSGKRHLEMLNDELKVLQNKNKRKIRANMSLVLRPIHKR